MLEQVSLHYLVFAREAGYSIFSEQTPSGTDSGIFPKIDLRWLFPRWTCQSASHGRTPTAAYFGSLPKLGIHLLATNQPGSRIVGRS